MTPTRLELDDALADLLGYWFGPLRDTAAVAADDVHRLRWWGKDPAVDREIEARFGPLVDRVADLVRGDWRPSTPDGATAAIVALDQLSRNIHRGTGRMYAHDALAVMLCRHAARHFAPLSGDLLRASFVFMPLMHSEALADQDEMVACFEAIVREAERRALPDVAYFAGNLSFAHRHREIVARFGRFPHRNALLDRPSTEEEEAFLLEPGSAF
jgi:uncharacterized protein (DUF924 family)